MRAMIFLSAGNRNSLGRNSAGKLFFSAEENKKSRRQGNICGIFMLSIKNYFKREQGQR